MNDKADGETEGEQRRRLHEAARSEQLERQRSNSESYDKAILTLSSGALGVSLTFIKDLLPASSQPVWTGLLYCSWWFLTSAIITTVASFLLSSAAINEALERITEYYLGRNENALAKTKLSRLADVSNYVSGGLFAIGVIATVLFVLINFSEVRSMKTKTGTVSISGGHTVPQMQKIEKGDLRRGQSIPQMQQVRPGSDTAASQDSSTASAAATAQAVATTQSGASPVDQSATQTKK